MCVSECVLYMDPNYVSQSLIYAQVLLGVVKEWLVINQCLRRLVRGNPWEGETQYSRLTSKTVRPGF